MSRVLVPVAVLLLAAGCGGNASPTPPENIPAAPTPAEGAVPWPAPPNPLELTVKAGLVPETHEFLQHHVHAHLDVFVNGKPAVVASGIGIDITNPAVRHEKLSDGSDGYGGIDPPCDKPCISPLHTHDSSGVLHTESRSSKRNTLGELFVQWDVALTRTCVGGYCKPDASVLIYENGKLVEGDPNAIELTNGKEIAIVIGTPPEKIPAQPPF